MPPEQPSDDARPIPSASGTPAQWHRLSHSRWVAAAASVVFFSVGLTAIVLALVHSARQSNVSLRPGVDAFAGAVLCLLGGHLLAARGWVQCFEGRVPSARLTRAYYSSQLGKYVPGGIWQPVSQVLLVGRTTSALHRTAAAYAIFIWTFVVSGTAIGGVGVAATASDLAGWARVLAALIGVLALLGLRREVAVFVVERMPARVRRGATADDLPAQSTIVACAAFTGAGLIVQGIAYAVLLNGLAAHGYASPIFAFVIAWLVGFLAIPVPAGLGVREAVLLAALHGTWPSALIVAASVAQRLTGIVAELLLVGATHAANLLRRFRAPTEPAV